MRKVYVLQSVAEGLLLEEGLFATADLACQVIERRYFGQGVYVGHLNMSEAVADLDCSYMPLPEEGHSDR
jgi:hypothetical protein